MTEAQRERVWELVGHRTFFAHHGDCVGADAEFDAIVRRADGLRGVIMHPSNLSTRAYCTPRYPHDVVRDPLDPVVRDKIIVDQVGAMIATPKHSAPVLRSGTWTTIRYAILVGRPLCIVMPDGGRVYDGGTWP
jgi:hypothetical protein